jgi:hypothetical protein
MAVEMTRCGNRGKPNGRLSTVPTNAWKSQRRRFPHSHRLGYGCFLATKPQKQRPNMGTVEKWKSKIGIFLFHRPDLPAAQGKKSGLIVGKNG